MVAIEATRYSNVTLLRLVCSSHRVASDVELISFEFIAMMKAVLHPRGQGNKSTESRTIMRTFALRFQERKGAGPTHTITKTGLPRAPNARALAVFDGTLAGISARKPLEAPTGKHYTVTSLNHFSCFRFAQCFSRKSEAIGPIRQTFYNAAA